MLLLQNQSVLLKHDYADEKVMFISLKAIAINRSFLQILFLM